MNFEKNVPSWDAQGTEPPSSLKTSGFQPGYKPPASYFNWFWYGISKAVSEIQTKLKSLSKADVGLGSVDNTSDASKSVKYASTAGTANATKANLTVRLNGGSTEGTNMFTFNGGTAKSVNVTASKIGAAETDAGIALYTHSKTGTVHKFAGTGTNGRVKMTANVSAGDTVQINGTTRTAYMGMETFANALAGESVSGKWLTFVFDGTTVNFKGGGGLGVSKLSATTAEAAHVLSPYTFYSKNKTLKTGSMLDHNAVGKNGAVGASSSFPRVAVTPVERDTQAYQNTDGVSRVFLKPPAGYYDGTSYVGETYATVANVIGLNEGNLCAGSTVLNVTGRGHAVAMFATIGDNRWSGGSPNRLKLAWTLGGTSGFGGWGCWLPAGTYRACGAVADLTGCYIADAGNLSTRIYSAEREYNSSQWGAAGTFTLNGSQWVSVTSGNSNYSELGVVTIYRVS